MKKEKKNSTEFLQELVTRLTDELENMLVTTCGFQIQVRAGIEPAFESGGRTFRKIVFYLTDRSPGTEKGYVIRAATARLRDRLAKYPDINAGIRYAKE